MLRRKIHFEFKKVIYRVQIKTITLYNLHVYIRKFELLHIINYKWKYMNVVNSGIFFLSDLEELNNRMLRVKNRKRCDETVEVLAYSVCTAAWGNCTFDPRESLQIIICDKILQWFSNAQLAFCWIEYVKWEKFHWEE